MAQDFGMLARRFLVVLHLMFAAMLLRAGAAVYQVGPQRQYKSLQDVAGRLAPGDTVTVDGGVTYPGNVSLDGSGAPGAGVIVIRGLPVNGSLPTLSGGLYVLRVRGSHYLIQGFDLTADSDPATRRVFYNVADDVTLRDSEVRDTDAIENVTGIAGSDTSGSLTLDHVEVRGCGNGLYAHQIYVGSSLTKYPGAVFTMRHCYVHDGLGGNGVKSRVTRNLIEYNWIEGAKFHNLDLDGPDPQAQKIPGGTRCDADVIGNVFISTSEGAVARLGGDGGSATNGRYRFVNNTVILEYGSQTVGVFWLKQQLQSLEVRNNVFCSKMADFPYRFIRDEVTNPPAAISGAGNWISKIATFVPASIKAIRGDGSPLPERSAANYRGEVLDNYAPQPLSALAHAAVPVLPELRPHSTPPSSIEPKESSPLTFALQPLPPERINADDIGAFPVASQSGMGAQN